MVCRLGLILALLWPRPGDAGDPAHHWPLDTRPALTSTFGEYRNGRFHAGLDLKTWGREGFQVWAVDDGDVVRLRTSPWGYGRVIYQKLRDGRTAVYAHLSGFAPRLSAPVEAEQDRKGFYSVDLAFDPGEVSVRRGEVIGFSGSTGVGMPHLHFEVRDADDRPVNALEHGFSVSDSLPPTIRAISLTPLTPVATVEGGHDPVLREVAWSPDQGCYLPSGRFQAWGDVGVSVDTYDRADASASENRLAPYRLRLFVDDAEAFEVTYSEFPYADNHQVDLDRNFALGRRGAGRLHNLYRVRGNRLPIYGRYREGDGILHAGAGPGEAGVSLASGLHRLRVVVEDFAGNRSEARSEVLVNAPPEVRDLRFSREGNRIALSASVADPDGDTTAVTVETSRDGGKSWTLQAERRVVAGAGVEAFLEESAPFLVRLRAADASGGEAFVICSPTPDSPGATAYTATSVLHPDFALVKIEADRVPAGLPLVSAAWEDRPAKRLIPRQTGPQAWEAVIPFDPEVSGRVRVTVSDTTVAALTQQTVTAAGGTVRSEDGMAEARFPANRLYEPLFARVDPVPPGGNAALSPVGVAYRFSPDDVPFDGKAEVTLRYPPGFDRTEKLGLYRRLGSGRWVFLDNRLNRESGSLSAEVGYFSTCALLLDETPPVVADLSPASGAEVSAAGLTLSATIRDNGSGIWREADIRATLDGKRLIVEYDPDRETIRALTRTPLSPGRHRFEVRVRDICGNEAKNSSGFTVLK